MLKLSEKYTGMPVKATSIQMPSGIDLQIPKEIERHLYNDENIPRDYKKKIDYRERNEISQPQA